MINNKPLLSISIPTKNRQYYCIEAIKHILSYDNQDFELCIHDHSDDRTIEEFISTIEDKRLKYIYTTEAISSIQNMSRSIEMTSGEYVCMIGDDDTILQNIFKWVQYMKKNNIDSISSKYIPEYIWPEKNVCFNGTLKVIKSKKDNDIEEVESIDRLKKLFENGIINYQKYNLPRVYHGIIKKEVLNKIYEKIGFYFAGLSPDIYSTVALSYLVKRHIVINEFLTIAGACSTSTTFQSRKGEHKGVLSSAPHLKNNKDYVWDEMIPMFYSVQTIWAETAITSAKDFSLNSIVSNFNKNKFISITFVKNKDIKSIIYNSLDIKGIYSYKKFKLIMFSYIYGLQDIVYRGIDKIKNKKYYSFCDVENINKAASLIN